MKECECGRFEQIKSASYIQKNMSDKFDTARTTVAELLELLLRKRRKVKIYILRRQVISHMSAGGLKTSKAPPTYLKPS
jgi:hypothetical protein